jgi:hypothetical protein
MFVSLVHVYMMIELIPKYLGCEMMIMVILEELKQSVFILQRALDLNIETTLAAVEAILVHSESDSSTASWARTVFPCSGNLALTINLVKFENGELDLLVLVMFLLGLGIRLFLSLLSSSSQTKQKIQCGLLLNVIVKRSAVVFQLLTREDQTLLVRRDTFLILNFLFDVIDSIELLDIKSDGRTSKCLHKDLHPIVLFYNIQIGLGSSLN